MSPRPPDDRRAPGAILIVDDDDDVRGALALWLECEGYAVATAGSGAAALAWLAANPPPRLLLLDLVMPHVDGWAVLDAVRVDARLAGVPVVICTGAVAGRPRPVPAGVPVLAKPFDDATLLGVVRTHCG